MDAHVEFFANEQDAARSEERGGLGLTRMWFNVLPEVGDTISLTFPEGYVKYNKWFKKLPASPYIVTRVYRIPAEIPDKIEVYFSGPIDISRLR